MSKLFRSNKPPKQAEPEPVAPVPDDELMKISKEREYQRKYGRKGRSGTVLSGSNNLG